MASEAECEAAFRTLAEMLTSLDPDVRSKYAVDRTVSCRVSDLGITWYARVNGEGIQDITTGDSKAQVRLTVGSNDLLALVSNRLALKTAFATGRLRIQASPFDLLRLGAFL